MKFKHVTTIILLILFCRTGVFANTEDNKVKKETNPIDKNKIDIKCSPTLNNLLVNWITEYRTIQPTLEIKVDTVTDFLNQEKNNICFVSEVLPGEMDTHTEWRILLGHDVIVPIINSKNPLITAIYQQGIPVNKFAQLFNNKNELKWAALINGGKSEPLHFYTLENTQDLSGLAKFLNVVPNVATGINFSNAQELISAVQKDIYAFAFCKLSDIRKPNTNQWAENIALLPIDKNQNGQLDHFENIYNNPDAFSRSVWAGKYPAVFCGNIYAFASNKPTDTNALQFIHWIVTKGDKSLNTSGYIGLASIERELDAAMLPNTTIADISEPASKASGKWIIIISGIVIFSIVLALLLQKIAKSKSKIYSHNHNNTATLNETILEAPKGLYFDKTHTWAFMEKDGCAKIGINDFLLHVTGAITRVYLKEPGEPVRKGEKLLTLTREGKQLTLYSPISGTIRELNPLLLTKSKYLNSNPYTLGWAYLVEPKNWLREIQFMFMADTYKQWVKDEIDRLKDFFSEVSHATNSAQKQMVLQDGGNLCINVLENMEPEVWEDFQTKFIDTSK